jgi:hypothetical protein
MKLPSKQHNRPVAIEAADASAASRGLTANAVVCFLKIGPPLALLMCPWKGIG